MKRRELLRHSGLSVVTGTVALSSGCLDGMLPSRESPSPTATQRQTTDSKASPTATQRQTTNSKDSPTATQTQLVERENPSYTAWLYAPGRHPSGNHYVFTIVKPQPLQQHRSSLSGYFQNLLSSIKSSGKDLNYSFESIAAQINFIGSNSYVTLGEFAPDEVATGLRELGFTEEKTYNGYTLFGRHSGDRPSATVAVNSASLISDYKHDSTSTEQIVETIIDAKSGAVERYIEQKEGFATLIKLLQADDIIWTGISPDTSTKIPSRSVFRSVPIAISGGSIRLDTSSSLLTFAFVLKKGYTLRSSDKETLIKYLRTTYFGDIANEVSFSQTDRVLLAETEVPTTRINELTGI